MFVGCTDYLYPYIQRLVVELNMYTLAVFITTDVESWYYIESQI